MFFGGNSAATFAPLSSCPGGPCVSECVVLPATRGSKGLRASFFPVELANDGAVVWYCTTRGRNSSCAACFAIADCRYLSKRYRNPIVKDLRA
jgi:hypothetical protein